MKAITVRQPWAWAIIRGGKTIENRSQLWSYRGPLAIHASIADPEKGNLASRRRRDLFGSETDTTLVFGAILGVVDLVDAHRAAGCCEPWGEQEYRDGALGRPVAHLVLADPRPLAEPIPWRGALGLWDLPYSVLAQS